ncbi:MAG: hypothetical protein EBZ91_01960 [Gammaproteobacteria bacterium]|nr:hypothetical protein [Gammaproteobacteria bacterium]
MRFGLSLASAWAASLLLSQGHAAPAAEIRTASGTFNVTAVSPPTMAAQSPDLAVGPDGSVNLVWLGENTAPPNAAQIAARGHSHDSSTNLYFARSRGKIGRWAFETPRRLNIDALSDALTKDDGGSFATIATGPQQQVYAAWIDTRTMTGSETARAALTVSSDDGETFTPDFEILPAMVCPCCQLSSVVDSRGRLVLGARLVDGKFRDNEIVTFSDQGRHLDSRHRVAGARWELEGCPRKPTAIAVRDNQWATAFYAGAERPDGVYTSWSQDGGNTWSTPRALHPEAKRSDAPALVFAGHRLFVVWQARLDTEDFRLFASVSEDGGRTFSEPSMLPIPAGVARLPAIAAHTDGSIQIAWQQDRSIMTLRWRP